MANNFAPKTGLKGSSTTAVIDQLINPQVIGAFLNKKLVDKIALAPFATIDTTLQNTAGDTLSIPQWKYIGDAKDVDEYGEIVPVELKATMETVSVKKVVQAVTLSDEAILSAHVRPVEEATNQIATSIAQKIDNDFIAAVKALDPVEVTDLGTAGKYAWILEGQASFGEDLDEATALIISPATRAAVLSSPDFVYIGQGNKIVSGQIGTIFGIAVVISNKVADNEAILIREGALSLLVKRGFNVEPIRDGIHRATTISADQHYAAYVRDTTKVVYLKKKAGE